MSISSPARPYYYGISQGTINGGVSGGNPDPISMGTAWALTLNFAQGTLGRIQLLYLATWQRQRGGPCKRRIWWLEGEGANPNNTFSTLVMSLPNYLDDNNGYYGVGVLNLWSDINHTYMAQDQLILYDVPDGGSTAMLLGLGFLGLFVGRWKLNRRSQAA